MNVSGQQVPDVIGNPAKHGLCVLVIDDDECVGAAIQAIPARRGNEARLVSRAYAGIQALKSSGFDAIILDLFMPGMNGLDTIAHIGRQSAIPIVAMSGFRLRNSLNSTDCPGLAMQCGASTFLRKPFALQQLVEALDLSINAQPCLKGLRQ